MFCPNSSAAIDHEEMYLRITSFVSCILSIIGAVIIVLTYCCMKTIRNTTRKLVTVLSVADFITSAGFLTAIVTKIYTGIPYPETDFCSLQSAVTTYSSMVSFFLTIFIAGYLFFAITRKAVAGKGFYLASNIVSWITPGIVIGVALKHDMLGRDRDDALTIGTGPWCWIRCNDTNEEAKNKTLFYMLFTGKFWEISCYLLTATFYVLLKFKLYLHHRFHTLDQLNPDLRCDDRNFLYVWLVLLAVRIWGTIRFLITAISTYDILQGNKQINNVILFLQAFGDPSQAFFNCILFCLFDTEVRGRMARVMKSCVPNKVNDAPKETDSTSSPPSVCPSDHESQFSDSSSEVSETAKLVDKEKPGHEKLYQSVNCRWSESNEGST